MNSPMSWRDAESFDVVGVTSFDVVGVNSFDVVEVTR